MIRIFDLDIMVAGLVAPQPDEGTEVYEHHDARRGLYRRVVVQDGRLIGAVLVGQIEQGGVLTSLIQGGQPISVSPFALMQPRFHPGQLFP